MNATQDLQVHLLSLAEAREQLAQHMDLKPAEPWESLQSQAWLERKASLELWILLESRRQAPATVPDPIPTPVPVEVPARARKARPKHKHHHRRRFRLCGVLG